MQMTLIFLIVIDNLIASTKVSKILNYTYKPKDQIPLEINDTTCRQCLCQALTSLDYSTIYLNCYESRRLCEIYFNYTTNYTIENSEESTFYFYPDPPPKIHTSIPLTVLRWNKYAEIIVGETNTHGTGANQLKIPYSLTFDSNGTLYIPDYGNNRIQKLTQKHECVTVAGSSAGENGSNSSLLWMPVSIAFDSNNTMYFTDRENHRVLYWRQNENFGTVVAGNGTAGSGFNQLNHPTTIILDEYLNYFYVSDVRNHRIIRFEFRNATGTIVAGNNGAGTATNQLHSPYGFNLDKTTNSLYIANYYAHTIVRWILGASNWTLVAGVAGSSGTDAHLLDAPLSIFFDRMRNMYVADTNNHRIQMFRTNATNATTVAGISGSNGSSLNQLDRAYWAILDENMNLYVADSYNHRILRFNHS